MKKRGHNKRLRVAKMDDGVRSHRDALRFAAKLTKEPHMSSAEQQQIYQEYHGMSVSIERAATMLSISRSAAEQSLLHELSFQQW